jgi:DNA (cytosine-5)-methyltransferase 1
VKVANYVTAAKRDNTQNYVLIPEATKDGYIPMEFGGVCDLSYPNSNTRRGRVQEGGTVAPTLTCSCDGTLRRIEEPGISVHPLSRKKEFRGFDTEKAPALRSTDYKCPHCVTNGYRIRKLTERECFRLMGVCEEYIDLIQAAGISRSQQYKMAGNSIVVDVLVAIFRQLLIGNKNAFQQLEIF